LIIIPYISFLFELNVGSEWI